MRSLVPVQMASRLVAGLAHILALGADSRQAALRRYQSYVDFAQK